MTLREARDAKGWTQEQLEAETKRVDEKRLGVDQTHISKIERCEVRNPKNNTVVLLELALGIERGTLIFGREAIAS